MAVHSVLAPKSDIQAMSQVITAILIFDRLLESGHFYLNNRFELGLREPGYANLFRATEPLRAEALTLTRKELALKHPDGLLHL